MVPSDGFYTFEIVAMQPALRCSNHDLTETVKRSRNFCRNLRWSNEDYSKRKSNHGLKGSIESKTVES